MRQNRYKQNNKALAFLFALCLLLGVRSSAYGWMDIMSAPAHPLRLVVQGSTEAVVNRAILWTPGGRFDVEDVRGMRLAASAQSKGDVLLWKLTFLKTDTPQKEGIHIWIGSSTSRVWVASSPVQASLWDAMTTTLTVPKGTAVYVSTKLPGFDKMQDYSGRDVLTFVYTIRVTDEGPAFVPVPEVYKQLAEHQDTVREGEFEPLKRLAYQRQGEEYLRMAEGKTPSVEAIRTLVWKRLYSASWGK